MQLPDPINPQIQTRTGLPTPKRSLSFHSRMSETTNKVTILLVWTLFYQIFLTKHNFAYRQVDTSILGYNLIFTLSHCTSPVYQKATTMYSRLELCEEDSFLFACLWPCTRLLSLSRLSRVAMLGLHGSGSVLLLLLLLLGVLDVDVEPDVMSLLQSDRYQCTINQTTQA